MNSQPISSDSSQETSGNSCSRESGTCDEPSAQLPLYELDPRSIQVEVIAGAIFTIVLTVGAAVGLSILWLTVGFVALWFIVAACALLAVGLFAVSTFAWPRLEFKHYRWRLDEQSLEIHRGVWFRHRISIPLGRVQHADVAQGPLLRKFGLGKLTIHTAGTSNASIELGGLSYEVALQLRDRLVQQAQTRVVT